MKPEFFFEFEPAIFDLLKNTFLLMHLKKEIPDESSPG
jgi:hypothetical protein